MKKRILEYLEKVNKLLNTSEDAVDWENVLEEHLQQIAFFQHERFVHLIVTVTFAILAFLSLMMMVNAFSIWILLLFLLVMILLIPYISHYYLLENSVQAMYAQYDEIRAKIHKNSNEKKPQ